jgi:long-chain acyl-CoA synthetase
VSRDAPASLAELAEHSLARLGDHPALEFDGTWHTSGGLSERASRLSAGLTSLGVRPGDRVAVCMANCPEVLVTYQAVWRAGAAATPVISAVTPAELRHILRDAQPAAVVVSPASLSLAVAADAGVRVVLAADELLPGADLLLGDLEQAAPGPVVPRSGDDLAALLYTGGTTGRSKGVMLSHAGLSRTAQARASVFATSGARDLLLPLPLSHVYGLLSAVTRLHMPAPGFVALQRRFDAAQWLEMAQRLRVQAGALVPSMLQLLLREDLEAADLSALTYLTVGGAPLPAAVRAQFERRMGGRVVVCDGYGCTEATSTVTMNPPTAPRAGSVGTPLPGVEVRVLGEDGLPLPAGVDGEVCVRSPGVMLGYWRAGERDAAATAEAVVDGWLRTGDLGHLDADGYLYVVDRKKDLIIRGGFNVYPRDVEDALLEHSAVAAAAVVGRPDPTYGEEVVAFLALRPGAAVTEQELIAFSAERLGRHKHPREVRFVPAVPLTSVGKTDRKAVRRLLADPLAAPPAAGGGQ